MNKKYLYSALASLFLLVSCDYNEDNFDGFDDNPVTDVIYYEGGFTGKYPDGGYFSLMQGNEAEGKKEIESALSGMLKGIYPYCDAGSTAKITVKVGEMLPSPLGDIAYTLVKADYTAMGTAPGQPGQYGNFNTNAEVNGYLIPFCTAKYADVAVGKVVRITYKVYRTSPDPAKCYKKTSTGWEEIILTFTADKSYTLLDVDYDRMGTDVGEPGENNCFTGSEQEVNNCIDLFLKEKYKYVAKNGMTVEVTYNVMKQEAITAQTTVFRYNGEKWLAYNPENPVLVSVTDRIAVAKNGANGWELTNLISGVVKKTMVKADYATLVNWVKANQPAGYMQDAENEYYFGTSSKYGNINNKYTTWSKYYNVDGYLTGLEDDQIQAIMDKRLANDGIASLLLPAMITEPDADMMYEVTYKIYGGRGDGDYSMSFYYNKEDKKFEWDEATPRKK